MAGELREWDAGALADLRDEYLAFLEQRGESALERDGGPEHVTASCFVLSPNLAQVLLCFHRKGRFWVQLGGHVEPGDDSTADAALREAREESGAARLQPLGVLPLDLDRHALGDGFGRCSRHWDVGYGAIADPDAPVSVSDESDDVAWWPVDALPAEVPPGFAERLAGALAAARLLRDAGSLGG
ncbi:NUDIX hydrolase [Rathayibacter sp. AY1E9]|nr:NUDIX hydrolase [Rathayibacter sp. AY1E9]PPH16309.1 NUDIX hydrolase [Rathayibacter sp. AY1F8]PPH28422.1 NUDIX hydrolase [Rathayibacter sp. AY1F9]PPH73986.1 NUDIX hydrolase [Rathayibacter sp. AY1D4]PPH81774.1 NUDIX hydrolase [Rathayibacter sp. AY1D9]PPH89168.1 NUDIX hydrolase [Rathayibacter sp. AY1D3]PPH98499.1 NUDIX hydrolase [Rathayibacter sp. AY1B7]